MSQAGIENTKVSNWHQIAIGRSAIVGQPRYWLQSAVSQIMTSVPLNFSVNAPKIITFKY